MLGEINRKKKCQDKLCEKKSLIFVNNNNNKYNEYFLQMPHGHI